MRSPRYITSAPDGVGLPVSDAVVAGGLIYTAGAANTNPAGRLVGPDIRSQTSQALDRLESTLARGGSSLANAVSVMVYLRDAADFSAMNEVYRGYWTKDPPARTTVIAPLAGPDALLEISVVAVPDGGERVTIRPDGWMASPNPYSYAVRSGDTLFLSGLISRNGRDNSVVKGDVATQTATVLDNASAILKEGGMTLADVVSARVFLADTADFDAMNEVYRRHVPAPRPARATVRAAMTAGDYLVEITLVAVTGTDRHVVPMPNADGSPAPDHPNLSPAIRIGGRLFVSGALGGTASNAGDVGAQTRGALARVGRTLDAAGFTWSDVVEGIVYLPDLARFGAMDAAYGLPFAGNFPARTTIGAGLMGNGADVEIMFTAVK